MPRVALIPGDGIGVEVVREARRLIEALDESEGLDFEVVEWDLGAERYLRDGVTITDEEFAALAEYDAVLLGALGDPRVPGNEHAKDILLGMRFKLDLYVNFRPCVLLSPELSPLRDVQSQLRIETFRENTEGAYTGMGGSFKTGTPDEIAIEEDVNTRKGVERIIRASFEFADSRGRGHVTLVDKANAQRHAGGLWRRVFAEVGAGYPNIEQDAMYVDAMVTDLVRRPQRYEVIVTSNLFGDIDPGRNALFEPVHGSAPDIAGTGTANPVGAIRCVSLMLDHFGHAGLAARVEAAVTASVQAGMTTPDLGGTNSTTDVGQWIITRVVDVHAASD
jgi:3-isopropylmalate dehydrogenase